MSVALERSSDESGADEFVLPRSPTVISEPSTDHAGEGSGHGSSDFAFVSTAGADRDGEVWIGEGPSPTSDQRLRVTCNDAVETHPVVHTDRVGDEEDPRLLYQVAYASDASGDWDIYVASTVIDQPGEDETLASLLPRDCDGWTSENITGPGPDALNDLWPAWLPDGSGIVYSSAGPAVPEDPDSPDPLGDIFRTPVRC